VSLDFDVLLGVNGGIWITRTMPREWVLESAAESDQAASMQVETLFRLQKLHADTPITNDVRLKICRVRNTILLLAQAFLYITPDSITEVYLAAEKMLLSPAVFSTIFAFYSPL
jgi:hypothetical protein